MGHSFIQNSIRAGGQNRSHEHCVRPLRSFGQPRKGLDVDIASAMASKEADKRKILNSIALPRARTKILQQEAHATHESIWVGTLKLRQSLGKILLLC